MRDYRSDGERMADEAMQAAIMVCDTCKTPTPPGRYWFRSNAAGENLGGIFCSKACVDADKSPVAHDWRGTVGEAMVCASCGVGSGTMAAFASCDNLEET